MTKYEYFQQEKKYCEQMAQLKKADLDLFIFYRNAAKGFEIKRNKLTLAEAGK